MIGGQTESAIRAWRAAWHQSIKLTVCWKTLPVATSAHSLEARDAAPRVQASEFQLCGCHARRILRGVDYENSLPHSDHRICQSYLGKCCL